MLAKINSGSLIGLDGTKITVEVDIASVGLPSFTVVGLPAKSIEESKERVRSAIKNSGLDFPIKRITVNLSPADIPKEGSSFDLPIAVGILSASGQIPPSFQNSFFVGELSLDGSLNAVKGAILLSYLAKNNNLHNIFLPSHCAKEASIVDEINVYPVTDLVALIKHLNDQQSIPKSEKIKFENPSLDYVSEFDLKDIKGQEFAKRALEIAAAGGHNIFFRGVPGAGKTMLARSLPSILPPLSENEALEVTKIYSIAGISDAEQCLMTKRPFRSPHHTISCPGLVGGGSNLTPGEITLAHRGVLFLDEFSEFPRFVLESIRQPLEDGFVNIARIRGSVKFPSKFILIAASNLCPCGKDQDHCTCTSYQITNYQSRISGPLLDRIDLFVEVPAVKIDKLTDQNYHAEDSHAVRSRVTKARNIQLHRLHQSGIYSNSEMKNSDIKKYCLLEDQSLDLLRQAVIKMQLSARAYYRIIKLARTIADLDSSEKIQTSHIAEAIQYRKVF